MSESKQAFSAYLDAQIALDAPLNLDQWSDRMEGIGIGHFGLSPTSATLLIHDAIRAYTTMEFETSSNRSDEEPSHDAR